MPKLTQNVLVRDPRTGAVKFLEAGEELPDWAKNEVGPHALDAPAQDDPPADPTPYDDLSAAALKAEIDGRNEGRDKDAQIKGGRSNSEKIAALVADDEAQAAAAAGEGDTEGQGEGDENA